MVDAICAAVLAMYGGDIAIAAQNILSNSLGQALAGAAFARAGRGGSFERMPRGPLGSQCFGEGTPVETDDGLVPIESVAVGELVWSRDEATGEEGYHEVVRTFVRSSPVMELEIVGADATDTLVVTAEHPFWRRDLEGGGWVRAQDLLPGDEVFTSRGGWARIGAGTWLAREQLVYNLEVEGSHTYVVGETGTWVHNACFTRDQQALHDLAREASRAGVSRDEAARLLRWGREVGLPGRGDSRALHCLGRATAAHGPLGLPRPGHFPTFAWAADTSGSGRPCPLGERRRWTF